MINWIKRRKKALLNLALLLLALVNQFLQLSGRQVLPVTDEQVATLLSYGFTVLSSLWAYWKNNDITESALKAGKYFKDLKELESLGE